MTIDEINKRRAESFEYRMGKISSIVLHYPYCSGNIELENDLLNEVKSLCEKLINDRVVARMPRHLM